MPEEAWVLKCYSCKKFQVQLKKKAKKWKCKVCNAKQDLMTIFYKGQPKECRIHVQQMNSAKGEMLDKLQEQNILQDESCNQYENFSTQNCDNFPYDEADEFTDDVIAELDEIEENYSQEIMETQDCEESFGCDTQEIAVANHQQFCDDTSSVFKNQENESIFETDFNNFNNQADTFANTVSKNQKQNVKPSIFESNCDLDESLDF